MTAAATTAQRIQDQPVGIAGQPVATLRSALTAFIDTVLDNLAGFIAGPDDLPAEVAPASAPSRAAIVGNPDPRITRSLRTPAHHE